MKKLLLFIASLLVSGTVFADSTGGGSWNTTINTATQISSGTTSVLGCSGNQSILYINNTGVLQCSSALTFDGGTNVGLPGRANGSVLTYVGGFVSDTGALALGQFVSGNGLSAPTATVLLGTTKQVTVTNQGGVSLSSTTLSLPQNIDTAADTNFHSVTVSSVVISGASNPVITTTGTALTVSVNGSNILILNTSSATLNGVNITTYNGANNLVQLNGSSQYPANDGSLITNIPQLASTQTFSGTVTDKWLVVTTSAAIQGTGGSGTIPVLTVAGSTFVVTANGQAAMGEASASAGTNFEISGTSSTLQMKDGTVKMALEAASASSAGIVGTTSNNAVAIIMNGSTVGYYNTNNRYGLGTTNPATLFDAEATGATIRAGDNGVNMVINASSANALGEVGMTSNHALGFITNNTLQGGILANGNWGIQTTNPGKTLDVIGTARFSGGIVGSTQADSASAGNYGEYASSGSTVFVNVASSGTFGNVVSGSLTAGNWNATGCVTIQLNGATITDYEVAVSSFSGNTTTDHTEADNWVEDSAFPSANAKSTLCVNNYRITNSGTTTFYLKVKAGYTVATPQAIGVLKAYRPR